MSNAQMCNFCYIIFSKNALKMCNHCVILCEARFCREKVVSRG